MSDLTPRQILDTLVAFPTVSRDSNLELIAWVENYLDGYGVTSTRVMDPTGRKAALYANVGPEVEGGIVLSGHTDVVPVDGQAWDTDPFKVTEKGTRLYGRGTCDMKGFDALALAAVPRALERGLKRPLQIALSFDEEVGCTGAPLMIDDMVKHLPRASAAIIGEPSMMKAVTGHKGTIGFETRMRGFEVHSSLLHKGVSAVMFAARLIDWANRTNAENMAATPDALAAVFEPPFTTLHVGRIEGGTAHNITAKDCHFDIDMRVVPGESVAEWKDRYLAQVAEVQAEMQAIHPDTGIDLTPTFDVPPLKPEERGTAERLVRQITGDNGTHVVSFATEAGQFQERGYSAVVCGPGNIDQAHQPNEYIECEQFEAGEGFLHRVIATLCT